MMRCTSVLLPSTGQHLLQERERLAKASKGEDDEADMQTDKPAAGALTCDVHPQDSVLHSDN